MKWRKLEMGWIGMRIKGKDKLGRKCISSLLYLFLILLQQASFKAICFSTLSTISQLSPLFSRLTHRSLYFIFQPPPPWYTTRCQTRAQAKISYNTIGMEACFRSSLCIILYICLWVFHIIALNWNNLSIEFS